MTVQVCGQCTTRMAVGLPACPNCGSNDLRAEATTLPSIVVQCGNTGCAAFGRQARIVLRQAAPGFLEVPPTVLCRTCGYEAETVHGWPYDPTPEGNDMAKITVHGGPTNAALDAEQDAGAAENATAPAPATDDSEGVASSPGTNSSTSSGKARKKPGPKPGSRQRRAPTTENPSATDQTDSSTAPGTGGGQTEPTSTTGSGNT